MNNSTEDYTGTYYFGVCWDTYNANVEARLTKDLIAASSKVPSNIRLIAVSDKSNADRVLKFFGIDRSPALVKATLWLAYSAIEKCDIPESEASIKIVIDRDLRVQTKRGGLAKPEDSNHQGYALPPQGRIITDSIGMNRPRPNGFAPVDPAMILFWD